MSFEITNNHVQRAMEYLDLMTRQGQTIPRTELDAFATVSLPRPEERGPQIMKLTGSLNIPVQLQPAQPVTEYLIRMAWVVDRNGQVELTTKGHLVLRATRDAAFFENSLSVTLLDPDSPFVYADVEAQFSDPRNDLLIDRYVEIEQLRWSFEKTTVRRILTTKKSAKDFYKSISSNLRYLEIEIRVISEKKLHDRALLRQGGSVLIMGQSLDGFGRQLSLMVELPPAVAAPYQERILKLWDEATMLSEETKFDD